MPASLTLTGTQKAAVVLLSMDQASAAKVMKQFTEAEAEEITAEIVRLRRVDNIVAERTLTEFLGLTLSGGRMQKGGREVASGLLKASFGDEKAAGVMLRVATSMAGKGFEFLDGMDPARIGTLLDGELPQTVALVLAHLSSERASAIMAELGDPLRTDVARCIVSLGSATPETLAIVAETLKASAGVPLPRETIEVVGGVQPLVDIINRSNLATERAILEGLEAHDPELAEAVRARMLTFADIVKLEDRDVQKVLRGLDVAVLAVAMKGAADAVVSALKRNLSERNRELLDDEIGSTGPVRVSQVDEARAEIVRSIRDFEAKGEIAIRRGEEEESFVD
ncbi:flagellar motor switch protein FliG [Marisediminicola antarctica]|uniref:Flagellar motor switch protein FliG n=1 Tax=Marisediminicola antarctica TaxID=674079 RepID=A0A7L5AHR1_9MICO|nr:flagellar motor switch protein FliG [Marisediminicola antarctica]QHO68621.1 flagellar motor switch protein FliG [Marisediminicola antarctica]